MTNTVQALVTEPNGDCRLVAIDPNADTIRALIDGWLEVVGGDLRTWIAYGDEEGNLKGKQGNGLAAGFIMAMRGRPVAVVGTVVFFGLRYAGAEDGYMEADIPDELRELAFPLGNEPANKDL